MYSVLQERAIKSKSRKHVNFVYICQHQLKLEKLNIFAKLELEIKKLENSNSHLLEQAELELKIELE